MPRGEPRRRCSTSPGPSLTCCARARFRRPRCSARQVHGPADLVSAEVEVSEWRPDARSGAWWSLASIAIVVVGLFLFGFPLVLRTGRLIVEVNVAGVAAVVLLTAVLTLVHEGIHGAAIAVFGGRPEFGRTMVGGVMPALYTTAPGHRFSRGQYIVIATAPAVIISVLGFAACFVAAGPVLFVPLALHLGGCTGDAVATWKVLRQPPGTIFEDLRDGIRFHRAPKGAR